MSNSSTNPNLKGSEEVGFILVNPENPLSRSQAENRNGKIFRAEEKKSSLDTSTVTPATGWMVGAQGTMHLTIPKTIELYSVPQPYWGEPQLSTLSIKNGDKFKVLKVESERAEVSFAQGSKVSKGWVPNSLLAQASKD